MLHYHNKLVTALSVDPLGIARILLAKGFIPENTEAQLQLCSTPQEKATILVSTVIQRIEIAPKRFHEFLDILSKQEWTKSIIEALPLSISPKQLRGVQAVSTGDHDFTDYTFPILSFGDKAELEAQLILSADIMRKKFASLLVSTVNSFQHRGIDPQKLASVVLALMEYDDHAIGKPLLEREKEALMKAQTVDCTFDILRPHMTFFNYEILEFLIESQGTSSDRHKLQKFRKEFGRFCRQSVFEVPPNVLGHSTVKAVDQQKFRVIITKQFKAALLAQCTEESEPHSQTVSSIQLSSSAENREAVCAPEVGISLEVAKHVQRKLASILKLKVSSIYLDSVS